MGSLLAYADNIAVLASISSDNIAILDPSATYVDSLWPSG